MRGLKVKVFDEVINLFTLKKIKITLNLFKVNLNVVKLRKFNYKNKLI